MARNKVLRPFSPNQYPIPVQEPGGFSAKQFIHKMLTEHSPPARHFYIDIDRPIPINKMNKCGDRFSTIEDFVRNVAANGHCKYDREPKSEVKPLDIPVKRDSYVVIELDPATGWTFDTEKAAITLGSRSPAHPNNTYGALHYVDANGDIHDREQGCTIAFFSAKLKQVTGYKQSLNFNVVTMDGTPTSIDPDIRYPGVGGD